MNYKIIPKNITINDGQDDIMYNVSIKQFLDNDKVEVAKCIVSIEVNNEFLDLSSIDYKLLTKIFSKIGCSFEKRNQHYIPQFIIRGWDDLIHSRKDNKTSLAYIFNYNKSIDEPSNIRIKESFTSDYTYTYFNEIDSMIYIYEDGIIRYVEQELKKTLDRDSDYSISSNTAGFQDDSLTSFLYYVYYRGTNTFKNSILDLLNDEHDTIKKLFDNKIKNSVHNFLLKTIEDTSYSISFFDYSDYENVSFPLTNIWGVTYIDKVNGVNRYTQIIPISSKKIICVHNYYDAKARILNDIDFIWNLFLKETLTLSLKSEQTFFIGSPADQIHVENFLNYKPFKSDKKLITSTNISIRYVDISVQLDYKYLAIDSEYNIWESNRYMFENKIKNPYLSNGQIHFSDYCAEFEDLKSSLKAIKDR